MDNYPEDIWDYLMYYAQPTEGGVCYRPRNR